MKADKFTKFVLAIIAVNLTVLTVSNFDIIPKAYASESETSFKNTPIGNYGLVPLNEDGSINVKLQYGDVIDVRLRGIDEASNLRWEAIRVKVQN